jgi:hypothetical protein
MIICGRILIRKFSLFGSEALAFGVRAFKWNSYTDVSRVSDWFQVRRKREFEIIFTECSGFFISVESWITNWYLIPLTPELNPFAQRCLTRFLPGILLPEPCISLIYAWKTNKYTNYSFTTSLDTTRPSTIFYRLLLNWASLRRLPEDGNIMPKYVGATIHN